jgi:hypothetical protein
MQSKDMANFGHSDFSISLLFRKKIRARQKLFCILLCFLLAAAVSFPSLYLYGAMNYKVETPLSDILTNVHPLHFERRKMNGNNGIPSMTSTGTTQGHCGDADAFIGCSYWNPSIFPLNPRRYLIAVRESTRQNCGSVVGTLVTLSRLLFKPAISNVLIGSFNPNKLVIKHTNKFTVHLRQQLPDSFNYDPNAYHRGQEDPRWIKDGNRLYLLSSSERHSKPRLFLTRVTLIQYDVNDKTDDDDLVKFGETIELKTSFNASYAQKNWMHVPVSAKDKPEDCPLWLLFVQQITPVLQLVWVDPESGTTTLIGGSPQPRTSGYNMRGSSMFIPETTDTYLGLIHTSTPHPASLYGHLILNIYYSYLIRLRREPTTTDALWKWNITHMTSPLAMPTAKHVRANRIQFPTTIIERGSEFWISMGDMDCDSHIFRITKRSLVKLLY